LPSIADAIEEATGGGVKILRGALGGGGVADLDCLEWTDVDFRFRIIGSKDL
jgi:hypothetical protein